MADPSATSVIIPAFDEGAAVADGRRRACARRRVERDSSSSTTARPTRPADAAAGCGRARHPPPVQQGQRRRREDRHPPRVRRMDSDHRRATASISPRMRCGWSSALGEYDLVVGARSPETQATAARRLGNDVLNALAGYLAERDDPGSDLGLSRGAARAPARVPAPAAERLLDADDDHAGVSARRLQRALRADRGAPAHRAVEDPARARRRQVLSDSAEGHHDLQPAEDLRADQRGGLCARRGVRRVDGLFSIRAFRTAPCCC